MRGLIVQPMLVFIYISSLCGALVHCGTLTSQPSVESMTFSLEVVDRTEEFSIQATAFFSEKHQAYKYEFSGSSQMFIYPKLGQMIYYYPSSDFLDGNFDVTNCWTVNVEPADDLASPLPSLEGMTYVGPESLYDTPAEKYEIKSDNKAIEIWVKKHDVQTGIKNRPIRMVQKIWNTNIVGVKADLEEHMVTEYFGFSVGEQPSWVWEQPNATCQQAGTETAGMIEALAGQVGAVIPSSQVGFSSETQPKKKYAKGRKTWIAENDYDLAGINLPFPYTPEQYKSLAKELPKSFDWRNFGAVTPVKNQRLCGSCWAFGMVGSLEGAYFLKTQELAELSEQALVDCAGSKAYNTDGCFGGTQLSGFLWMSMTGGIPSAEDYIPYQETNGHCQVNNNTNLVAKLEGYYQVPNDADAVKVALVKLGPLVVSIDASPIMSYKSGVFSGDACSNPQINHSVLLVGYGESSEDGPYWIIKNSWDITFGLEGYFLLTAEGNCLGILDEVFFPVLSDADG